MTEDEKQYCRVYNLWIMKSIWKKKRGVLSRVAKYGEKDPQGFYTFLGMSKESLRIILNYELPYNYALVCKHAREMEDRTGVPHEYLTGEQFIQFIDLEMTVDEIVALMEYKEIELEVKNELKELDSDEEFEKAFDKKIKKIKKGSQDKYEKLIKRADNIIYTAKMQNSKLTKALDELCSIKNIDSIKENDMFLYRLMYYVVHGNKYEEIGVDRIIEYMGNINVNNLSKLQIKMIANYIKALNEQLEIAREAKFIKIMTNLKE